MKYIFLGIQLFLIVFWIDIQNLSDRNDIQLSIMMKNVINVGIFCGHQQYFLITDNNFIKLLSVFLSQYMMKYDQKSTHTHTQN